MLKLPTLAAFVALGALCADADTPPVEPVLQWVQALGGSGSNQVTAAATDGRGNLYIIGNTTSNDFPVKGAAQVRPGSSTLTRINGATTAVNKLYPPGLSAPTNVAIDPQNPQTVYAAQASEVWRSSDGGDTWSQLSTVVANGSVLALAVDPQDSNTLYAAVNPQGVFKSSDGGATWTAINNGIPVSRNGGTVNAFRVVTDPNIPQVVFATADAGLFRSEDGGASWTAVVLALAPDLPAFPNQPAFPGRLAFDPANPGVAYINFTFGSTALAGKSTDDGKTFIALPQLPEQSGAAAVALDPGQPGVVFAATVGGIYSTSDDGAHWTKLMSGVFTLLVDDPVNRALYAATFNSQLVRSTDGFKTAAPVGPPTTSLAQVVTGGTSVFLIAQPTTDVFVVKLDPSGTVVYATYFGGTNDDTALGIAAGADGSVYVTGTTRSSDFPTTAGAFQTGNNGGSDFVFKLKPDGSLAWSTDFATLRSTAMGIAVDKDGNVFISGSTGGDLPTTAGAYQTQFEQKLLCGVIGPCFPTPPAAFVTKIKADGSGLIYSTYVPTDIHNKLVQAGHVVLPDASGNAYVGGMDNIFLLNADGSAMLAATVVVPALVNALVRDASGNVYAAGSATAPGQGTPAFPTTAGAFQRVPQPAIPNLPGGSAAGGDAFVMEFDSGLSQILAATLLGGEGFDGAQSIALDASGNVIISGATQSKAFPVRTPFQSIFSISSGFVAAFDSSLSHLLYSTYVGDTHAFQPAAVFPDGSGNLLLAGSIATPGLPPTAGQLNGLYRVGGLLVANKIALPTAPAARLDSVANIADHLAGAVTPGEVVAVNGAGFGPDAQLLMNNVAVPLTSQTASTLAAVLPDSTPTSGTIAFQVATGGGLSNTVLVPGAPAAPALYSVDGSGFGTGYILNSDGSMNSAANPAAPGSAITIFANGVGAFTNVGQFAVTSLTPAVFIDGFYCDGIAAIVGPAPGLPGNVYQLSIFVPDTAKLVKNNPDLKNFKLPPQAQVVLVLGPPFIPSAVSNSSQPGLVLNIAQ